MTVRPLPVMIAVLLSAGTPPPDPAGRRPTGPLAPTDCTTSGCHADVAAREFRHGPARANACHACHRVVSERSHTYELERPEPALCTLCHDMRAGAAAVVHRPLADGDCTGCHDPHGGRDIRMLREPSMRELCTSCHDDVVADRRWVHGPVAAGSCDACHTAHASPYPGLLKAEGADLCVSCHVSVGSRLKTARASHPPATGACLTCHDPHASDHAMLLTEEPQQLCLSCHESIKHTVETASTPHGALMTERTCLNCHDAHASDHPRVLRTSMTTLCFECHDREIKLDDGTVLSDIKAVLDAGTSLHGPVAQDNCAACHLIHGGDNFRMLVQEYPAEFYAPFKEERYALCFSCHDKQLVLDRHTTTLTNFRNGDLNLHFLHVNRETKGRTCRACHETHASNRENHVRESVPFGTGGWKLPIGFEQLADGGRCGPGCHVAYEYNRVKPVAYPTPKGTPIWPGDPSP